MSLACPPVVSVLAVPFSNRLVAMHPAFAFLAMCLVNKDETTDEP